MFDYQQPDFYHFSEDSVWLADFVSSYYNRKHSNGFSILDIGSGCGIVGIETILKINNKKMASKLSFLEAQSEFKNSLEKNILNFRKEFNLELEILVYFETIGSFLKSSFQYDLIISNPPYFRVGSGKKSKNENRQKCNFFELDSFELFLELISQKLKKGGVAFFVGPFEFSKVKTHFSSEFQLDVFDKANDSSIKIFKVLHE